MWPSSARSCSAPTAPSTTPPGAPSPRRSARSAISRGSAGAVQSGRLAAYRAPEIESGPVDAVNGAFMLMRRSAFEEAGGFDEGYWMYMEDLDLSYRLRQQGWLSWYEPSATVGHRQRRERRRPAAAAAQLALPPRHGPFLPTPLRVRSAPPAMNALVYLGIAMKLVASARSVAPAPQPCASTPPTPRHGGERRRVAEHPRRRIGLCGRCCAEAVHSPPHRPEISIDDRLDDRLGNLPSHHRGQAARTRPHSTSGADIRVRSRPSSPSGPSRARGSPSADASQSRLAPIGNGRPPGAGAEPGPRPPDRRRAARRSRSAERNASRSNAAAAPVGPTGSATSPWRIETGSPVR